MIAPPPKLVVEPVVRAALAEDLGRAGDVTAQACVPEDAVWSAVLAARKPGRVAGLSAAAFAFELCGVEHFEPLAADGDEIAADQVLARVRGSARGMLAAERTALNLVGRLSGVATLTAAYVKAVEGTGARIADTRKTTPGLRALEKHAVRCGGGLNHRFGLDDAILLKDNHVAVCGGVGEALRRAKAGAGHLMKIEVEVDSLAQLEEALPYAPDVVMLDNFSLEDLRAAVALAGGRTVLEASGGVSLQTVRAIAETGVHVISVGALTHSAPALDVGLDAA